MPPAVQDSPNSALNSDTSAGLKSTVKTEEITNVTIDGERWNTISTFSPLLKEAFNDSMKTHKGSHTFTGAIKPAALAVFRACAGSVRTFEVNQRTEDDGTVIPVSLLTRVQKELGNLPFFPNLRVLYISSLASLIRFAPFVVSPSLKEVGIPRWNKWSEGKRQDGKTFEEFLRSLLSVASGIESFTLDHPTKCFDLRTLKDILRFRCLRVLVFQCPVSLGSIDGLKMFTAAPHLEELWLAIFWWGWKTQVTDTVMLEGVLSRIKRLVLSAPSYVFREVVQAIDAKAPECILGGCQKTIWEKNEGEIWGILTKRWPEARKVLITSKLSEGDEPFGCADAFEPLLRERLNINSIWLPPNQARTICVADSGVTLTLVDLRELAEILPKLTSLTVSVDPNTVPPCDFEPLRHGLEELILGDTSRGGRKWTSDQFDVARYLHCVFPHMKLLETKENSKDWEKVWQLVRFSQKIAADERRRPNL
ncbi:hypothetical protein P691DRAFT_762308 [Macrolepiota fuliginosa MF-IS2]|uniref:Uncharacterized protein n=1 Tax=Macrolepiota fuliginosa MF-IS2 TaxID=1400762 RepID=A0A9P6C1L8_9AGAR|nr:hypothetical protein P691DRAFT_762308 [Macrolepiota fuliginosa MF-IS2]